MKTNAPSHTKTLRLARRMGCSRALAVGVLTLLWDLARREHKDGYLSGITYEDLAAHFGMDLDEGTRTVGFLIECGWLDAHPSGEGWLIHDWFDHCEWYVIRDLITAGLLPDGWERGDPVPERPLSLNSSEQVATRCNKSPSREGKGKVKGKGKSSEGEREGETGFDRLWALPWKRKRSKADARKAWTKHVMVPGINPDIVIDAAGAFLISPEGLGEFSPGPAPWVNQERWEDDPSAWNMGGGPNQNGYAGADFTKFRTPA